jgi:hypothetical protein
MGDCHLPIHDSPENAHFDVVERAPHHPEVLLELGRADHDVTQAVHERLGSQ